jgi:hypothetical protein
VGGALAALLGVVSPTYALVLPLVLPVVSLIAALQREDLTKEVRAALYLHQHSSKQQSPRCVVSSLQEAHFPPRGVPLTRSFRFPACPPVAASIDICRRAVNIWTNSTALSAEMH